MAYKYTPGATAPPNSEYDFTNTQEARDEYANVAGTYIQPPAATPPPASPTQEARDEYAVTQGEAYGLETGGAGTAEQPVVDAIPGTEINEGVTPLPTNQFLFQEEAAETAAGIYDPLISGAEAQLEAVDFGAALQIEGINQAVPYITRQFEAYAAKSSLGTGMLARQQNELIMDIAETVGAVYDAATLQKYEINSTISQYQSAMAAGEYDIATQLYNQSLSQAQFASDYLGLPYIQPEVGYVYDQMTAAQGVINDPNSSAEDVTSAQATYDSLSQGLQDLGYTGDIGDGLVTYQQQQQAIETAYLEMEQFIANELYDAEMSQILSTNQAFSALISGTLTIEEVMQQYPGADFEKLLDLQESMASSDFDLTAFIESFAASQEQE